MLRDARVTAESQCCLSNGNGTFKAAKAYPVPAGVDNIAVGDFNGDGKLDALVGRLVNMCAWSVVNTMFPVSAGAGAYEGEASQSYSLPCRWCF